MVRTRQLGIGEAAREVGRSAHTLRYWEDIGLVPGVVRNESGHRRYTDGQVSWLKFLDRLRGTGMPIARMRRYAELAADGASTLGDRYELLGAHRADLESQLEELRRCLAVLERKLGFFAAGEGTNGAASESPESACVAAAVCEESG